MPYLRQRQKIPATGRIAIKLTTYQRDQLIANPTLPRGVGHLLHRSPVKQGKLLVRLSNAELDELIRCAAQIPTPNPPMKRAADIFLSYLEAQADRFEAEESDELAEEPSAPRGVVAPMIENTTG